MADQMVRAKTRACRIRAVGSAARGPRKRKACITLRTPCRINDRSFTAPRCRLQGGLQPCKYYSACHYQGERRAFVDARTPDVSPLIADACLDAAGGSGL